MKKEHAASKQEEEALKVKLVNLSQYDSVTLAEQISRDENEIEQTSDVLPRLEAKMTDISTTMARKKIDLEALKATY